MLGVRSLTPIRAEGRAGIGLQTPRVPLTRPSATLSRGGERDETASPYEAFTPSPSGGNGQRAFSTAKPHASICEKFGRGMPRPYFTARGWAKSIGSEDTRPRGE
jgi:hypothetical protein